MNNVLNDLQKTLPDHSTIIAAISGGPDSMCLLNLLLEIKKEKNIKIVCAHVNHKLRKESDKEATIVKDFCKKNKIAFEYMEINNYDGNIENHARKKRYEFFDKLISKYNSKYLLTAHHGDDLIETMMMRLSRGNISSFKGFTKISKRKNYNLYRPLITLTKEDILNYLKDGKITYVTDKSNKDDKYTRNRFRKYILPELKKENNHIHENFLKLNKKIDEYEKYIYKDIKTKLKDIYNKEIDLKKLTKEADIIKEKIIYLILEKEYKDNINLIKDTHISEILKIINSKKPNQKLNLPLDKVFIKEYEMAKIEREKNHKTYNFIFEEELKLESGHIIKKIKDTEEKSNYVIKLNSKEISLPLHIRTKQDGDKMEVKGLNGSKKIKDIFIDSKVPITKRDTYPIMTDDENNILWIPGIKKSKFDKSKDKNYDIIVKCF